MLPGAEPSACLRGNNHSERSPLDEDLIAGAKRGDTGAFAQLVERYQEPAFRAAYLVLHDASDAEDATQEAMLKAYRALTRFRAGSAFRPWLLKIVMNQALTMVKSRRRRTAVAERAMAAAGRSAYTIDDTLIDRERAQLLASALESLREQERVVVYLRYFLSFSEKELAEYLGCAPGTVKSRLHRALARLRQVLARQYPRLAEEIV